MISLMLGTGEWIHAMGCLYDQLTQLRSDVMCVLCSRPTFSYLPDSAVMISGEVTAIFLSAACCCGCTPSNLYAQHLVHNRLLV